MHACVHISSGDISNYWKTTNGTFIHIPMITNPRTPYTCMRWNSNLLIWWFALNYSNHWFFIKNIDHEWHIHVRMRWCNFHFWLVAWYRIQCTDASINDCMIASIIHVNHGVYNYMVSGKCKWLICILNFYRLAMQVYACLYI